MSELRLFDNEYNCIIAGVDEAGRGPLAGPVVAAAVILTNEQRDVLLKAGLKDSKKLTEPKREILFREMCSLGVTWAAQAASPHRIDRMNILQASLWCMRRSVEKLSCAPDMVLVDGNKLIPFLMTRQKYVIKGDDKVPAISAASVIAKVLRDRVMLTLDKVYPEYGFAGNKGYPSLKHRDTVLRVGPSPVHRLSFKGVLPEITS